MNILVIGYGSIGRRHVLNLSAMKHKVWVYDIDDKKVPLELIWNGEETEAVFICSPTPTHADLIRLWRDKYLFVEKPLVSNRKDLDKVILFSKTTRKINMVACNMRFEPLIRKASYLLLTGAIGDLISVKADFGYYLPYWRPDISHKLIIHSGVVFDCFHDLDLLLWLHGKAEVKDSATRITFAFDLDYSMAVCADAILEFGKGLMGNIHFDYFRREKKREIEWIGTKGVLTYQETRSLRKPSSIDKLLLNDKVIAFGTTDHNHPYKKQVEHFFECIEKGEEACNPIRKAIETTELALKL